MNEQSKQNNIETDPNSLTMNKLAEREKTRVTRLNASLQVTWTCAQLHPWEVP